MFPTPGPPGAGRHSPASTGFPFACRGVGAVKSGLPSAVRGMPAVGYFNHCAEATVLIANTTTTMNRMVFMGGLCPPW